MDKYEAFKQAYADVPSQDNEGYTPDRGAFKCGFLAAWDMREAELKKANEWIQYYKNAFEVVNELVQALGRNRS